MTIETLCKKLKLADTITNQILQYQQNINFQEIELLITKYLSPDTWEIGTKELQEYCKPDESGIKILTICLHCITNTYDSYRKKGIPEEIFWDTMYFIPRFLQNHMDTYGIYAFTWAWWIPRQISMNEFRIGEYEYEFVKKDGVPAINIHIPSDANLITGKISAIYDFTKNFYPEYNDAQIYCDSWLMSPALNSILPPQSRILYFQNQFEILKTDEDSPYFMDWIYSRLGIPYEELPENTLLQRNAKRYLLDGGKIGTAYGRYLRKD